MRDITSDTFMEATTWLAIGLWQRAFCNSAGSEVSQSLPSFCFLHWKPFKSADGRTRKVQQCLDGSFGFLASERAEGSCVNLLGLWFLGSTACSPAVKCSGSAVMDAKLGVGLPTTRKPNAHVTPRGCECSCGSVADHFLITPGCRYIITLWFSYS